MPIKNEYNKMSHKLYTVNNYCILIFFVVARVLEVTRRRWSIRKIGLRSAPRRSWRFWWRKAATRSRWDIGTPRSRCGIRATASRSPWRSSCRHRRTAGTVDRRLWRPADRHRTGFHLSGHPRFAQSHHIHHHHQPSAAAAVFPAP